jgi:Recombination protein O C terminal
LIEQATETETPLGGLFQLCRDLLEALPGNPPRPQLVFAFELKLLVELGLDPDLSQVQLSGGAIALIRNLQRAEWPGIARLHLSADQVKELSQFLHGFLIYHLGRIPKGRDSALEPHLLA